ncbi:MAG TPA: response regulator transcription factor [Bryobacteraceae bacterium]|nr:response regulator transcription factor [Bryobacteraceae bacterium]
MAAMAAAAISGEPFAILRASRRAIRVLTVDEHHLIQEGLAAVINREDDMAVIATAATGEEALEAVRRLRPDVVTLDLVLPDMPGEDLARRILAEFPRTRIVAITSSQGHVQARRALDAGVHGYISKAAPRWEMVRTIRQVRSGARMVPGPIATKLAEHFNEETLTAREIQVLQLVAWGNRNKEVAAQLSIAEETVRMHMKHISGKLAANDRTHAVTIAMSRGLLRLRDLQ